MRRVFPFLVAACALGAPAALAQDLEHGAPYILPLPAAVPSSVAVDDARDRLLVVDTGGRRVLYATISDFETGSETWLSFGELPVIDPDALLNPQGIAVDADGNVFVVDSLRNKVRLFTYDDAADAYTLDAGFASTNATNVDGTDILLPRDIAASPDAVWLLDSGNHRILKADGAGDTSWEVWGDVEAWGNPYGLDVRSGDDVVLAVTDTHQIWRYEGDLASISTYGHRGTDTYSLQFPRDVAWDPDGHLAVADTWNHRVRLDEVDGSSRGRLGDASLFQTPASIAVDDLGRLFVVDAGLHRVVAWLGPDAPKPFDLYVRDFLGDVGVEPSTEIDGFALSSPDIVVRHAPDVDPAALGPTGLQSFPFEQPRYDRENYVYVELANLGPLQSVPAQLHLYWADPASGLVFPDDWNEAGFYRSYTSAASNIEGNWVDVPESLAGESAVVGPLVFRPPAPESVVAGDGVVEMVARYVSLHDPSLPSSGYDGVRESNNIALRELTIQRGPFPIGPQNTLVTTVMFADLPDAVDPVQVEDLTTETNEWVMEVSYGLAWLEPI